MAHRSISSGRWPAPAPAPRVVRIPERTVVRIPAPKVPAGPGSQASPGALQAAVHPQAQLLAQAEAAAVHPQAQLPTQAEAEAAAVHPQAQLLTQAAVHPQAQLLTQAEAEAVHPQAQLLTQAEAAAVHPQAQLLTQAEAAAQVAVAPPRARNSICTSNVDEFCRNRRFIDVRGADHRRAESVTGLTRNTGIFRPALRSYIA